MLHAFPVLITPRSQLTTKSLSLTLNGGRSNSCHSFKDLYHSLPRPEDQLQVDTMAHQQYAGAHPTHAGVAGRGAGYRYASQQQQDLYEQDTTQIIADYYSNDGHSNWDTKSYQSDYSQAHLTPQQEMKSVNVYNTPPVPPIPYQAYPPAQQPYSNYSQRPAYGASPAYSSAREKLLRRRVSRYPRFDRIFIPIAISVVQTTSGIAARQPCP